MGSVSLGAIPENEPLTFTEESVEEMKDMMRKTKGTEYEYASTICREGTDLKLIGEQKGISRVEEGPRECPDGTEFFGDFHTHPSDDEATLSFNDKLWGLATGAEVMCVGCEDKISCFEETDENRHESAEFLASVLYANNSKSWDVREI